MSDNARFVNALRNFLGLGPLQYTRDSSRKMGGGEPPVFWDSWPTSVALSAPDEAGITSLSSRRRRGG